MEDKYIPVWKYAKLVNQSRQNIYRWVREQRLPSSVVQKKKVEVERIFIREDFRVWNIEVKMSVHLVGKINFADIINTLDLSRKDQF